MYQATFIINKLPHSAYETVAYKVKLRAEVNIVTGIKGRQNRKQLQ
jgi:hypothetical protein